MGTKLVTFADNKGGPRPGAMLDDACQTLRPLGARALRLEQLADYVVHRTF